MPLYPTEKIIWDENIVPTEYYSGEGMISSVVNTEHNSECWEKKAVLISMFILSSELICSTLLSSSVLE